MIDWKRLALLGGLSLLLILMIRGCVFACSAPEIKPGEKNTPIKLEGTANDRQIDVYLHEQDRRVAMGLEDYLVGVVAAEMPSSFHEQALCAQAVAARTYTLRTMENGGCKSGADICSDSKCCQAYDSDEACRKKWNNGYASNIEKVRQCVYQTAGEALYYDGELIEALYHAASGGYTEDSENVFAGTKPYLRSVKSQNETGSSYITDEKRMSKKDFVKAVNAAFKNAGLKTATLKEQVKTSETYSTGRVKTIQLGGATATGREFRAALELRSAWFTIEYKWDDVIIKTKGYGHGVGMSQTGANGMAQEGADYKEILAHYYTDTNLY
ncbi:stage II sporulation protein D [Christensenellaceae bacterium OttesenSCG-928-M15]|nr:stage II sporulation protein D [Christensenellaceae bacterium OttesenSCG-928-M15]